MGSSKENEYNDSLYIIIKSKYINNIKNEFLMYCHSFWGSGKVTKNVESCKWNFKIYTISSQSTRVFG
jgi:hypothetical protein